MTKSYANPAAPAAAPEVKRHIRSQSYAAELTAEQEAVFDFCRAGVTWFYNEANASQLDRYRHRVPVEPYMNSRGKDDLSCVVAAAKQAGIEFPYRGTLRLISEVPSVMLHGALKQLHGSWNRHFSVRRDGKPSSPPRFRSIHRGGSLYWQVKDGNGPSPVGRFVSVTREGTRDLPAMATVRIPGQIGRVVIRYHRELPADAMVRFASLRVDELGKYWVVLQYDTAQVRQPASSGVVGVDVGVAVTAATSDGKVYDTPGLSPGQQQRKDRLQRSMARKRRLNPCKHDRFVTVAGRSKLLRGYCPPPGRPDHDCGCWKHSRRYEQAKAEFLKLSQQQVRQRTAAAHLASRALAEDYAVVVVEDLDVSAMTSSAKGTEDAPGRNVRQKAGLNREILARNWYQLRQFAAYKTLVVAVPAPHTSQTCPRCGTVDPANRPERDLFRCVGCGLTGHADIVAAQNIRGRYAASTAAAQAVAAREICPPGGEQPANLLANTTIPEVIELAARCGLEPGGKLIPEAWGRIEAPKRIDRRRSQRPRKQNHPGNPQVSRGGSEALS